MSETGSQPAQNAGGAPGQRLREERERRGLSTQKVAEDLHVDPWVVEALEAQQFHALGAPVYVKGHLRQYAALLGLDGESLVAQCIGQVQPVPLSPLKVAPGTREPWRVTGKAMAIAASLVIAAMIGAWGFSKWQGRADVQTSALVPGAEQSESDDPTNPQAVGESLTAAPSGIGEGSVGQMTAGTPEAKSAAGTATTTAPLKGEPRGRVTLRMSFSEDSWVELYDADERRVMAYVAAANSARTVAVEAPARMTFGNVDAVEIEVNGQSVPVPAGARRGDVAHLVLDAKGGLRRVPRPARH